MIKEKYAGFICTLFFMMTFGCGMIPLIYGVKCHNDYDVILFVIKAIALLTAFIIIPFCTFNCLVSPFLVAVDHHMSEETLRKNVDRCLYKARWEKERWILAMFLYAILHIVSSTTSFFLSSPDWREVIANLLNGSFGVMLILFCSESARIEWTKLANVYEARLWSTMSNRQKD